MQEARRIVKIKIRTFVFQFGIHFPSKTKTNWLVLGRVLNPSLVLRVFFFSEAPH